MTLGMIGLIGGTIQPASVQNGRQTDDDNLPAKATNSQCGTFFTKSFNSTCPNYIFFASSLIDIQCNRV